MNHFSYMFNLKQLISNATRVAKNSQSAIDLIFCSDQEKICQSGVLCTGLSDHFITYCSRKVVKGQINKHKTIKIRSMKNFILESYKDKLNAIDWSSVLDCSNVSEAWYNFKTLLLQVIDDVAPIKEVRLKQRSEPWFDSDILEAIQTRDKALYKYRNSKNLDDYSVFKKFRNTVQNKVRKAKARYLTAKVEENM